MRVLVLHSRYRSGSVSGENRAVDEDVALLRGAGHDVEAWTPEPPAVTGAGLVGTGVRAVWSTEAAARVRGAIDERRPDVVHCHNLFPMLSPAVIDAAARRGVPVVLTLHNYRLLCLSANLFRDGRICHDCVGRLPWPGVRHACYRGSAAGSAAIAASLAVHRSLRTFDRIAGFLAVSEFVRAKHVEGGLPPERIRVRRHAAPPTEPRTGPGGFFLYVGRVAPEKGLAQVLEAWPSAAGRLVVVGDRAGDLSAHPHVDHRGPVPASRVPELLREARALLVPSRWYEPASRVVIEAYAAGVPVVASDAGGLAEVVEDGITGVVVDGDRWGPAIERLLDDDESLRLGRGALARWASSHTPQHGLRSLVGAYDAVVR